MPHRAVLCKQNQNCLFFSSSKITQPLTFVLSNISETRSWIQNLRPDLKSLKKRCPIVSHFVALFLSSSKIYLLFNQKGTIIGINYNWLFSLWWHTLLCTTVMHWCNVAMYCTIQYCNVQYCTIQYCTEQHCAVEMSG